MKYIIKFGLLINIFALIVVNNFHCLFYAEAFSWSECLYNGFGFPKPELVYLMELVIGVGLMLAVLSKPLFSTLNKLALVTFFVVLSLFYYPDFFDRLSAHYLGIPFWSFPVFFVLYWVVYQTSKQVEQCIQ